MGWNYSQSLGENIGVIELGIERVETIVQITKEEIEVSDYVWFDTRYSLLDLLHPEFIQ